MATETLTSGIKITSTHDWIRLDLGNGRGLTVSRGGVKASGAVPAAVFAAWERATRLGEGLLGARVRQFAATLPTLWPEWNAAPAAAALRMDARIRLVGELGEGVIKGLPKRKGGRFIVQLDGEPHLLSVTADMIAAA
jgi:hypothetical protein